MLQSEVLSLRPLTRFHSEDFYIIKIKSALGLEDPPLNRLAARLSGHSTCSRQTQSQSYPESTMIVPCAGPLSRFYQLSTG